MGASLFVHDHISEPSHRAGLERRALHDTGHRCRALPQNALDDAGRIDTPLLLLVGSENGLWPDSQALFHATLTIRQPQLGVPYTEIPLFGHIPDPGTPGGLCRTTCKQANNEKRFNSGALHHPELKQNRSITRRKIVPRED